MIQSHPGGGYEIFLIERTAGELNTLTHHSSWSQQAFDTLDVEAGLAPVRKAKIHYVILSSFGTTPTKNPRLGKFFDELDKQGVKLQEFGPEREFSPRIEIYQLK